MNTEMTFEGRAGSVNCGDWCDSGVMICRVREIEPLRQSLGYMGKVPQHLDKPASGHYLRSTGGPSRKNSSLL
jgi:hypothetical protein